MLWSDALACRSYGCTMTRAPYRTTLTRPAAHRLGADPAVVGEDLDLARRLDHPQPIEMRRHVLQVVIRKLLAKRSSPMRVFRHLLRERIGEALGFKSGAGSPIGKSE